jgi:cytochrome c55X
LVLAVALALAPQAGTAGAADSRSDPEPARQRELMTLLRQDCGSCHGMRMTGGLGPALTPQALGDKPRDSLAAAIFHGRPGTAMPPWRRFVSDAEALWLVDQLMRGLSDASR